MSVTYRTTNAPYYVGKGSNLTAEEFDANTYDAQHRLDLLETNPPTAVSISNIAISGSQVQFNMSDGSHFGPFALPLATFVFRPEGYVDGATYHELDLFSVPGQGLFLTRIDNVADGPFDAAATDDDGNALWQLVFGEEANIYDFGFSYPAKPGMGLDVGDFIGEHLFLRDVYLPIDCDGSLARLSVAPAADLEFTITKNGADTGTLVFPAAETAGVFTLAAATQFSNGDILALKKTAATDAAAKGFTVTFAGVRGTLA